MDYYVGEIRIFGGDFAPMDWGPCDGSEYSATDRWSAQLFSVIGRDFTPDSVPQGRFRVPDLRGRLAIGAGQGPGLSPYTKGQQGGNFSYTLSDVPNHNHQLYGTTDEASTSSPVGNLPAQLGARIINYSSATTTNGTLNTNTVGQAGKAVPDGASNVQPYLPINFVICFSGAG